MPGRLPPIFTPLGAILRLSAAEETKADDDKETGLSPPGRCGERLYFSSYGYVNCAALRDYVLMFIHVYDVQPASGAILALAELPYVVIPRGLVTDRKPQLYSTYISIFQSYVVRSDHLHPE